MRGLHVLTCLLCAVAAPLVAAEWRIDPARSTAGFTVTNMMVTTVPGTFDKMTGAVHYDPAEPEKASVHVEIDVASVNTGVEKRDNHLRSADFFEVEKYPKMSFTSTRVERAGPGKLRLTGNLSIKYVTKSVTFDVDGPSEPRRTPQGLRANVTATAKISRREFGLLWNHLIEAGGGVVVGDEVTIIMKIEMVEVRPPAPGQGS